ncbi:MAG: hypothetical protein ABI947_04665 [Chloroflexota bacterium]
MNSSTLERLESDIKNLTLSEQAWLLERLAHHIREQTTHQEIENQLESMAADPDIQRELHAIED